MPPAQAVAPTEAVATIVWGAPAPIVYGTPLSATQLNATASVAGSFVYSPALGTLLGTGATYIDSNIHARNRRPVGKPVGDAYSHQSHSGDQLGGHRHPSWRGTCAFRPAQLDATATIPGRYVLHADQWHVSSRRYTNPVSQLHANGCC